MKYSSNGEIDQTSGAALFRLYHVTHVAHNEERGVRASDVVPGKRSFLSG